MTRMTTQSTPVHLYGVFVRVPRFFTGVVTFKDTETFIDKTLKPGQVDSYGLDERGPTSVAVCVFGSPFFWIFPLAFFTTFLLESLAKRDFVMLAWVVGSALVTAIACFASSRHIRRRQMAFGAAIKDCGDRIAPVPSDNRLVDLRRIERALVTLQQKHGSMYDDRAREAVAAVLEQDNHRPDEKHLIIARSTASDADSEAIRERTLEKESAWGRDVARAEHLILSLEEAVGDKVPAAA